jgi:two-component system LytT family response regulator
MEHKKIRTVLIDDETRGRSFLKTLIQDYCPELEVLGEGASLAEGRQVIERHQPELVFLDIYLPDGDGFKLLEYFSQRSFEVVFTTAYNQHSLEAFEAQALQYLLKPIEIEQLQQAVQRYLKLYPQKLLPAPPPDRLAIVSKEEIIFIAPKEIIRCEADGNYTHLYLINGRHILSSKTLSHYEKTLSCGRFFRSHDKHLINLDHVEKYLKGQGGQLQLREGHLVAVSQRKRDALFELLSVGH